METSPTDINYDSPPPYYSQENPAYSAQPPEYSATLPSTLPPPPPVYYQPQQQSVVIVADVQQVVSQSASVESYSNHIILACIVTWIFNVLFGLIAYTLASK
jgi:hypothetical protein